jgi:tetratricopeptide (TPR) repeat protein
MECGKYDDALINIENDVKEFPELAKFFLRSKANILRLKGELKESEQVFIKIIRQFQDPWTKIDYAKVLKELDREEEALNVIFGVLYNNRDFKVFVNVIQDVGDLCVSIGYQEEGILHYYLSKLIREKEGWGIPRNLQQNISVLSGVIDLDINQITYSEILEKCRAIWKQKKDQEGSIEAEEKTIMKGRISLGARDRPYCFINAKDDAIICTKSILPDNIRENDIVTCEVIPSYDKKKKRDSWRAVKVMKE